jgi:hypothetical protein
MKRILVLLGLLACSPRHDVEVLLGPNEHTLTIGFRCYRDVPADELMFQRAVSAGIVHFSLTFDLITIDGAFPGCRGEDLIGACRNTGNCKVYTGGERYCVDITVPLGELPFDDPPALIEKLTSSVREQQPIIADDPPDQPLVVRAVASTQTCAQLLFSPVLDDVVGCAYSCPTRLDDIDGPLSLSLDTLTDHCEQQVRQCAAFPDAP